MIRLKPQPQRVIKPPGCLVASEPWTGRPAPAVIANTMRSVLIGCNDSAPCAARSTAIDGCPPSSTEKQHKSKPATSSPCHGLIFRDLGVSSSNQSTLINCEVDLQLQQAVAAQTPLASPSRNHVGNFIRNFSRWKISQISFSHD